MRDWLPTGLDYYQRSNLIFCKQTFSSKNLSYSNKFNDYSIHIQLSTQAIQAWHFQ